jgi:hypothetical protein
VVDGCVYDAMQAVDLRVVRQLDSIWFVLLSDGILGHQQKLNELKAEYHKPFLLLMLPGFLVLLIRGLTGKQLNVILKYR